MLPLDHENLDRGRRSGGQKSVTAAEKGQAHEVSLRRIGRLFTPHRWSLAIVTAIIVASSVVAMASRQLTAYYEDEVGGAKGFGRGYGFNFDPATFKGSKSFKEFWEKGAREFEDLGEFILHGGCTSRRLGSMVFASRCRSHQTFVNRQSLHPLH